MSLICVVDTETTGLTEDPNAAVIEVAATIMDMSNSNEARRLALEARRGAA